MDFSALIAELRDIANRYNGRDIDSNVSTAMYCEMFRKILQKAESEVTAYDDQIVILWMTLSQLCQTYQTLTTCNERNSLYQHIFLLCAKVVLNIKWQQLSDDDQSKQNFRATVEATHRQLVTAGFDRFGLLLKLMDNPWTDTTITKIMSGDQDEDDSDSDATEDHDADDEEIKEKEEERKKRKEKRKQQVEEEYSQYINREDPLILHLRVEMLMQENCEEWALNLCECCLRQEKFIRDLEFKMMQLQLLFKLKYLDKLQEVCESITCHVGVALLDRLEGKESNQALVVRLIQIFLVQDWIKPDRNCCTKTLLQIWIKYQLLQDKDREKFLDSVWAIAKLSSRTEQICQLITSLLKKCGMNFIQLYTDLCIYAINVDKSCCEQQMLQGNMEGVRTRQHAISMTCIKLADLYCNCSPKVARIAALTAFSLNPSIQNFNVVRKTYTDKRKEKIQSVKDDYSPQKESKPRQSRHLNKVNPSTLHEVERLLNMLRPYYLDPELPFQRLLPVCQKFMEEKGTFQQAPNKKPAVTSTVSKTTTKPTNSKKGKPKSPVSSDIPTNVQYYCDDTVTLQRQNSNSGVSSTSVAGVDNRLNPISSSTSQHKSPVYQSKSAHQTSVNNLYRQKPVVSVHKDLNSAPQHIRTSDSQNVQMPMGQGTKPPLFGTQPHSYRAIMHTEPAAAQPPPAPKSPIAATKQPVQRLVPVAELMQSLEVQRLQQVTELQKSKEIERANSITNLLKATKSTPKSQSSAPKHQHSQPQSQIKQMELTAIHNTTKAMHMDAIRRHSVHLPVQSVKSPIEERPIPHHISAPKDIDKSQLRPPLNKLRVSSVDASKFTATQKIIPKDLPPGLQHQFPPYGSEKTLTLGAGQSKTPQPFMLKPPESSSSKRRPSADELKSIVDWLQAGTEDAKPQAQPMQPKPAHTGQTAQKLPSFYNPLSSPQPAPAHFQLSQSSSPSMHSIGHSPQGTSSPQMGHDLSPAGSLGQNSMAAPGRSSTIHQAATEIQKKLVNLQRQNSTTNNTLGAQLLLNLQKKGLIGTTAAYGAAPPPSPVQTQASSNMHLTQSPAIIPVKPAVTTQPQVTSKGTSPAIQPQLVLSNIQSQVTQQVAQPKVKQPEAASSPLPQMLNPLQMPSKPGQKQLTDKDLSIEEMKLRIAEIVRQQTEAERLNPSTPPKLKRSSSPRQRSPKSRSRSTPTPTKTGAIEQTNVVTPTPSGMDEIPDQLTGSSSLGNLLRHSSVTPKKGKSQKQTVGHNTSVVLQQTRQGDGSQPPSAQQIPTTSQSALTQQIPTVVQPALLPQASNAAQQNPTGIQQSQSNFGSQFLSIENVPTIVQKEILEENQVANEPQPVPSNANPLVVQQALPTFVKSINTADASVQGNISKAIQLALKQQQSIPTVIPVVTSQSQTLGLNMMQTSGQAMHQIISQKLSSPTNSPSTNTGIQPTSNPINISAPAQLSPNSFEQQTTIQSVLQLSNQLLPQIAASAAQASTPNQLLSPLLNSGGTVLNRGNVPVSTSAVTQTFVRQPSSHTNTLASVQQNTPSLGNVHGGLGTSGQGVSTSPSFILPKQLQDATSLQGKINPSVSLQSFPVGQQQPMLHTSSQDNLVQPISTQKVSSTGLYTPPLLSPSVTTSATSLNSPSIGSHSGTPVKKIAPRPKESPSHHGMSLQYLGEIRQKNVMIDSPKEKDAKKASLTYLDKNVTKELKKILSKQKEQQQPKLNTISTFEQPAKSKQQHMTYNMDLFSKIVEKELLSQFQKPTNTESSQKQSIIQETAVTKSASTTSPLTPTLVKDPQTDIVQNFIASCTSEKTTSDSRPDMPSKVMPETTCTTASSSNNAVETESTSSVQSLSMSDTVTCIVEEPTKMLENICDLQKHELQSATEDSAMGNLAASSAEVTSEVTIPVTNSFLKEDNSSQKHSDETVFESDQKTCPASSSEGSDGLEDSSSFIDNKSSEPVIDTESKSVIPLTESDSLTSENDEKGDNKEEEISYNHNTEVEAETTEETIEDVERKNDALADTHNELVEESEAVEKTLPVNDSLENVSEDALTESQETVGEEKPLEIEHKELSSADNVLQSETSNMVENSSADVKDQQVIEGVFRENTSYRKEEIESASDKDQNMGESNNFTVSMTETEQTASISTTSESEIDQKAVDSQSSDQSEIKTDLHLKEDDMKDNMLQELEETKSNNADLGSNDDSELPLNSTSEDAPIVSTMEEVAEITSQVQDESTVGETASDKQNLHSGLQEFNDMDNVAQEKSEILKDTSNVKKPTEEELSAVIDTLSSDNQPTDEQTDLTTEDAKEDIKDDNVSFVPKEESSMNEESKDSSSSSGHIQTEITSADTIVQNEDNCSIFVEKSENEQSITKDVLPQKAEQVSPECNLDVVDKNSDLDSAEKGSEQKDIVHEKREDSIQEKESMDIVSKESPNDDKNMTVENVESLKVGKDSEKEVCHSEFETKDNSVVESSKSDERLITDHLQAGGNSDVTEVSESVDNEGKSSSIDVATIDIPESTEKQDSKEKEAVQVETESVNKEEIRNEDKGRNLNDDISKPAAPLSGRKQVKRMTGSSLLLKSKPKLRKVDETYQKKRADILLKKVAVTTMTNLKNSVSEDPKINDALRKASAMSTKIKKKNTEGSKQKAEKVTPKGVGSKKVPKVEKIKDDGKKYLVVDTPISEGEKDTQRNDCESVDMTHSNAETGSQNLRFKSMVLEIEQSLTNTDSSRPRSSESYKSDGDYEANRSVSPTSSAGSLKSFHSLDNFDEDGINFDDGSNNLFCLICGIRFKTVVSLRHHVRNACKSGRRSLSQLKDYEYLTFYRCSSCGRSSTSDVFLDEHVKRCTEKVNLSAKVVQCFKCEMCGLVSQDKAFIVTHVTKDCSRVKVAETQRNERFRMLEHVSSAVLSQGALKEQSSSDSKFEISHRTFSDESVLKCKLKSDKVIVAKKDFVKQSDENKKLSGDSKKCENEAFGFEDLEDVEDGKSAAVVKKDGDNVTRNLRNRQVTSSSQQIVPEKREMKSDKKITADRKEKGPQNDGSSSKLLTKDQHSISSENDRVVQQEVSTRVLRNSPRGKVSLLTEDSKVPNKFASRSDKPNSKETKTKHPTLSIKEDRESCIQTRSNKASNLQRDRNDAKSSVVQQKGTDDENDRSNKAVADQKEVNCKTRSHSGISERVDTSKAPSGRKNTQSIDKMHTRSRSSSSDIGKTEQQSRSRNTSVGSSVETVESLTTPSSSTSERFELRSSKRLRHDSGSTEKSWKSEDSDASATKTKRSRLDKHILQKSSTSSEKVETESVRSLSTEKSESDLITDEKSQKSVRKSSVDNSKGQAATKTENETSVVGKRVIKVKKYDQFEIPKFVKTQIENSNIKRKFVSKRISGKILGLRSKTVKPRISIAPKVGETNPNFQRGNIRNCVQCGKKFGNQSKLVKHAATYHLSPYKSRVNPHTKKNVFVCNICGTTFSNYCDFIKHVPEHSAKLLNDLEKLDSSNTSDSKLSRQKMIAETMKASDERSKSETENKSEEILRKEKSDTEKDKDVDETTETRRSKRLRQTTSNSDFVSDATPAKQKCLAIEDNTKHSDSSIKKNLDKKISDKKDGKSESESSSKSSENDKLLTRKVMTRSKDTKKVDTSSDKQLVQKSANSKGTTAQHTDETKKLPKGAKDEKSDKTTKSVDGQRIDERKMKRNEIVTRRSVRSTGIMKRNRGADEVSGTEMGDTTDPDFVPEESSSDDESSDIDSVREGRAKLSKSNPKGSDAIQTRSKEKGSDVKQVTENKDSSQFTHTVVDDDDFEYVKSRKQEKSFEEVFKASVLGNTPKPSVTPKPTAVENQRKSKVDITKNEGVAPSSGNSQYLSTFQSFISNNKGNSNKEQIIMYNSHPKRTLMPYSQFNNSESKTTSTKTSSTPDVPRSSNRVSTRQSFQDSFLQHCKQTIKPAQAGKIIQPPTKHKIVQNPVRKSMDSQESEASKTKKQKEDGADAVGDKGDKVPEDPKMEGVQTMDTEKKKSEESNKRKILPKVSADLMVGVDTVREQPIIRENAGFKSVDSKSTAPVTKLSENAVIRVSTSAVKENLKSTRDQSCGTRGVGYIEQRTGKIEEKKSKDSTKGDFLDTFKSFISSAEETNDSSHVMDRTEALKTLRDKMAKKGPFTWDVEESEDVGGHSSLALDNERPTRANSVASDDSGQTTVSRSTEGSEGTDEKGPISIEMAKVRSHSKKSNQPVRHMYHNGKIWQIGKGAVSSVAVRGNKSATPDLEEMAVREAPKLMNVEVIKVDRKQTSGKETTSEHGEEFNSYTKTSLDSVKSTQVNSASKWGTHKQKRGTMNFQKTTAKKR